MSKYYLRISHAQDLENPRERALFRLLEMLPGLLTWATLFGAVALSYYKPKIVAFFILVFVPYWFARAVYFSFHLKAGYKKMKESEAIDWLEKLRDIKNISNGLPINDWQDIYHLVILPMYKEPYELVKESVKALLKTDYPKQKMIVVLAQEERAGKEAHIMGQRIREEFEDKFFKFLVTTHPFGLPGELAGKGSNETWAAKKAKNLLDKLNIGYKRVLFSALDIDTVVSANYFSCLTYHYLTTAKPTRTSFQPIPLFLNNIWQAPGLSRVFSFSSSFWHITNQERAEKLITFSSHSMSFDALVDVGFKQINVVSEDSRIFWQCLLTFDGDYRVEPLHTSISMDANVAPTFWRTLINMYKQQRRWAYGVGEVPYFIFGFLKNKKISLKRKISLAFEIIEGHWSWACASILLAVLGWLPIFIGGHEFSQTLFSYNFPRITGRILSMAMIGLFGSIYYTFYLLPPKPGTKKKGFNVFLAALQWFLLPLTMVFFTALPAIDAQTRWLFGRYMGFWPTPKHR
ncbi:MAG: glycosyltransferase family 2 protein [Patescibacteria group bacterium]|nr:glycosyltransferase family 2 protein [Patescibacteria group bacterium]